MAKLVYFNIAHIQWVIKNKPLLLLDTYVHNNVLFFFVEGGSQTVRLMAVVRILISVSSFSLGLGLKNRFINLNLFELCKSKID